MIDKRTAASSAEPDWLPVGEEPQPVGSITEYSILRHDGVSLLSTRRGDLNAEAELATGMYARDTRYLSRLTFSFGGVPPILLDQREPGPSQSTIFTNPAIRSARGGELIPAQTLVVRRRRTLAMGLVESFTISNYGHDPVALDFRVQFDADFADIFEVRGYERLSQPGPIRRILGEGRVRFEYDGVDGRLRTTVVSFVPAPGHLQETSANFVLRLEPRDTAEVHIEVTVDCEPCAIQMTAAAAHIESRQQEWLSSIARIETDHDGINQLIQRSLLDILALQTRTCDDEYLAAGVPWFDTLFGRDSLIAGMELLAIAPEVLRTALLVLAKYQADETDLPRAAASGKIPHEVRWGELAQAGEVPFGRYYGSVDATPLFLIAAAEYLLWTHDRDFLRAIWGNVQRAFAWCEEGMRTGVQGFLSYARLTRNGLENQGWKDSHDAIVWPDGRLAAPPIALVEVQGYLAAAIGAYAQMAAALGEASTRDWAMEAAKFCQRLDEHFGDSELGYALALDGSGSPVPTPASNVGHLLWAGVARKDYAQRAASRLMQPDMFSGWGIRTLSSTVPGYNPLGYHVGSVWPHDNALVLSGMRGYGFDDHAERLGAALFQMGLSFPDYRVPELFSGDARELRAVPTPYPVASRPQAWSAAAMVSVLVSLLGIRPSRAGELCIVRPMLPREVNRLRIRNLRLGKGMVDLSFRRDGRHVSVEVERLRYGLEVVLSESWPDELAAPRA